jgi:hypothetical protein
MRNRFRRGFMAVLAVTAFSAGPVSAITILTSGSALDLAVGCTDNSCFDFVPPPVVVYNLSASAPVSGTFGITGLTLDFSIVLAAANLTSIDGAITSVDFSNVNYLGSVSVVDGGSGNFSIATQTASMSGTLTPNGAGSPVVFGQSPDPLLPVDVSGTCNAAGNILTCGLIFGTGGFDLIVDGNQRFFRHTVDITGVIPEPSTALLLGLGLSALAIRRSASDAHSG